MRIVPVFLALICLALPAPAQQNWPQFLGPSQDGHADAADLPVKWSETQNIRWKTPIPGEGWSSPVIWGNQVWLTTATPDGHSRRAICVDRETGRILRDVEVFKVDVPEKKNAFNSYASPTPVVEPGRVYVSFGTIGQACLDTATGKVLWRNQELKLNHIEGSGSSPIVYKNLYILHCDGGDVQYIVALDKQTGKIAWKTDRSYPFEKLHVMPDMRKAYSVPAVAHLDGKDQLISVGAKRAYGYDPETGHEIWFCDIPGFSVAPRPIIRDGIAYICTGYMKAELFAVRISGARGKIPDTGILWDLWRGVPLKPSPMVVDDRIYLVTDNGIARMLDRATGKELWQKRIGSAFSATPLYAAKHIYCFSESGETVVLQLGASEPAIVAENQLEAGCLASPAVSGNALFVRTKTSLYRIEN